MRERFLRWFNCHGDSAGGYRSLILNSHLKIKSIHLDEKDSSYQLMQSGDFRISVTWSKQEVVYDVFLIKEDGRLFRHVHPDVWNLVFLAVKRAGYDDYLTVPMLNQRAMNKVPPPDCDPGIAVTHNSDPN